MNPERYFSSEEKERIVAALKKAELQTTGEIRVHIENRCAGNVLDRGAWVFKKLRMHHTKERNGVLFFVALTDRKFAVLGDTAINRRIPSTFWNDMKLTMEKYFIAGNITEGITEGIRMAGEQMKTHFPRQAGDINELPDEISFGKEENS